MPELPEVEVIRRALAPQLQGRRIVALACGEKRLRAQSSPEVLREWLPGRRIVRLTRRGKYLLLELEGGVTVLLHLGMTGRLLLGHLGGDKALPHVHLTLTLEDGNCLLFQDVRRFGQILVYPPGETPEPLARVGQEPFSRRVTPAWLQEQARHRRRPVKNFLLDGRILAGIGNIYAAEILFAVGLHPETPVGDLTLPQWEAVLKTTRRILKRAIARGGTTVNDYLQPGGTTGLFQVELAVYGREGEPCSRCRAPIQRLVQAGRSTFFCPRCQPAPRGRAPQTG
ncbi:MAG: bifunctional DNA-formamidopyrimidine glycosylase/DNA-(apurinic or apyrimidinic site) lyase [Desulfobaccales bacterium]